MSGTPKRFDVDDRWHQRGRVVIGLDNRLLAHRGWTVEGVSTTEAAVLQQVALYAPDVCVVSTRSAQSAMVLAAKIAHTAPHTRAVMMDEVNHATQAQARAAGIAALLSEDYPIRLMAELLDRVRHGEVVNDVRAAVVPLRRRSVAAAKQNESRLAPLTSREREVLGLLADGRSTSDIAAEMGVSAATVRSHVQSVFTKLGVHSRLRAVALCRADVADAAGQAV
jgi:two-component system nitrate/nitrite response regulator NarL